MNKPQWPECEIECSWCLHRAGESMFDKTHSKWCKISSRAFTILGVVFMLWLVFGYFILTLINKS